MIHCHPAWMGRLAFWMVICIVAIAALSSCSAIDCVHEESHNDGQPKKCFIERKCADGQRWLIRYVPCQETSK